MEKKLDSLSLPSLRPRPQPRISQVEADEENDGIKYTCPHTDCARHTTPYLKKGSLTRHLATCHSSEDPETATKQQEEYNNSFSHNHSNRVRATRPRTSDTLVSRVAHYRSLWEQELQQRVALQQEVQELQEQIRLLQGLKDSGEVHQSNGTEGKQSYETPMTSIEASGDEMDMP